MTQGSGCTDSDNRVVVREAVEEAVLDGIAVDKIGKRLDRPSPDVRGIFLCQAVEEGIPDLFAVDVLGESLNRAGSHGRGAIGQVPQNGFTDVVLIRLLGEGVDHAGSHGRGVVGQTVEEGVTDVSMVHHLGQDLSSLRSNVLGLISAEAVEERDLDVFVVDYPGKRIDSAASHSRIVVSDAFEERFLNALMVRDRSQDLSRTAPNR